MADVILMTVSQVLHEYIRGLGLLEFPCGIGSWRETCDLPKTVKKGQLKPGSVCSYTATVDAQKEKSENLVELINSAYSPWYLDYSWSKEAKGLREIAVKSPHLLDSHFVYSYFRTLKAVDKDVAEVDYGLVNLKNLEELTLSANYITSVDSECLPPSLKVLELCANNIQFVNGLCNKPPPLQHLGLGRNMICFAGDYISGSYCLVCNVLVCTQDVTKKYPLEEQKDLSIRQWNTNYKPELVSLDLSHNNLIGLVDTLRPLCTLTKLRSLLLQGNPLSIALGYRAYVIDTLQSLAVLDDKHISIDDKIHFSGVAQWKDFLFDEAIVQLGVTHIRGLPDPSEFMSPEELSEVEKSYFVQFIFPVQFYEQLKDSEIPNAEAKLSMSKISLQTEKYDNESNKLPGKSNQSLQGHEEIQTNKDFVKTSTMTACTEGSEFQSAKSTDIINDTTVMAPITRLGPINSQSRPWEEELNLNWTIDIRQNDMLFLRNFFRAGMDVAIIEQTVEIFIAESSKESKSEKAIDVKEKDPKDKKKNKTQKKETTVKPATKEQAKDKGQQKKKRLPEEIVKGPPKFTTVASFHMPLDGLLKGEFECLATFTKPNDLTQTSASGRALDDMGIDKRRFKKKVSAKPNIDKKAEGKKTPREKNNDKKRNKTRESLDGEDEEAAYVPLQVELCVKLHQWLTVNDTSEDVKHSPSVKSMDMPV